MILVPRPAPHLPRTLAALEAAGHTDIFPLALSHPESIPVTAPARVTALFFTSVFGVQPYLPQVPAYCVGQATGIAAATAGYQVAATGQTDAATFAQTLTSLPKQHFLHLHGDHADLDWHEILHKAGHSVTPIQTYATHRILTLPHNAQNALASSGSHTLTLLFSAGSAQHLAKLYKHANMAPMGTAIALSPAVAMAATAWPTVITAPTPTLEGMLHALHHTNHKHN